MAQKSGSILCVGTNLLLLFFFIYYVCFNMNPSFLTDVTAGGGQVDSVLQMLLAALIVLCVCAEYYC